MEWLTGAWGGIIKLASALAGMIGDLFRYVGIFVAYRLGIRKERQRQVEKRLEQDNEAATVRRDIATDTDERKRLRDKYVIR